MPTRRAHRPTVALLAALLLSGLVPVLPAGAGGPIDVEAHQVATSLERTRDVRLPIAASHVAVHWRGVPDADVAIAFSTDGLAYGPAIAVEHDEVGAQRANGETYGAVLTADRATFVRVTSDRAIGRLTVLALDASVAGQGFGVGLSSTANAAVVQPAIISRAGWAANEALRFDADGNERWTPAFYPIQKLIVHHTAGRNGDPDPAATIRAIYYYHAVTQGWGDIGYNFLVDESGRIYEGRYSRAYANGEAPTGEDTMGNGVTAAHVQGYNSGTVGIALLGTLTDVDATSAAHDAVEQILAWKAAGHALDPNGSSLFTNPVNGTQKTFPNISGHRDLAATECPGGVFYATLPALRTAVAARISGTGGGGTTTTVPGAPQLTASQPKSGKGVALVWAEPGDGGSPITGYRVYRATGTNPSTLLAAVSASTTSYRDTAIRRRTTYTYTVLATNAIGEGAPSNSVTIVTR